ncbi:hypothetical protein F0562_025373 [Nyssa sinensis]|uniref:Malectin-like domain-containing protein n=1 Tax=Nyssa sinensis TaxID=561372 RepID=A0A5J5BGM3_9ASTE|nr:hypothetical protein F0562_025373 [Nyssa sinensis]
MVLSRIDGSALSGKIPDLIGNWTRIDRLRISDLNGAPTGFPDLQNLTNMNTLILRNCLITGQIPAYLGELTAVKTLGSRINFEGNEYEEDTAIEGPAYFFAASEKWAYSNTGVFLRNGGASYKANNTFSELLWSYLN